jgi:hypothetical protein
MNKDTKKPAHKNVSKESPNQYLNDYRQINIGKSLLVTLGLLFLVFLVFVLAAYMFAANIHWTTN